LHSQTRNKWQANRCKVADRQQAATHDNTRSPAVAGMADLWRHINVLDFHFRGLEMIPSKSSKVKGQGARLLIGQW
jgi:hypothetical protein